MLIILKTHFSLAIEIASFITSIISIIISMLIAVNVYKIGKKEEAAIVVLTLNDEIIDAISIALLNLKTGWFSIDITSLYSCFIMNYVKLFHKCEDLKIESKNKIDLLDYLEKYYKLTIFNILSNISKGKISNEEIDTARKDIDDIRNQVKGYLNE